MRESVLIELSKDDKELIINSLECNLDKVRNEIEGLQRILSIYKKNGREEALKMANITVNKIEKLQTVEEDLYNLIINLK